jgi:hypothetical protein
MIGSLLFHSVVTVRLVRPVPAPAVAAADLGALVVGLEDDVHHAGDGVRAIGGGGAVRQHLDALDGRERDDAHIDEARAARGKDG